MPDSTSGVKPSQVLAITGTVALIVGVFAPVARVPLLGSVTFFQSWELVGVIILGLALASPLVALSGRCRMLYALGGATLGTVLISLVRLQRGRLETSSQLLESFGDNPFAKQLEGLAYNVIRIEWGWAPLLLGAVILLAAAVVGSREG